LSDILAQGEGCPVQMLQRQRVFRDSRTSPRGAPDGRRPAPALLARRPSNRKGVLTGNLRRELMELLTLGMGNYTGRAVNPGIRI
jgi:hypothetical protein